MLERARALDAADTIAHFRDRFDLPEGVIYLDGNSLGPLPKASRERLHKVIDAEWGEGLIRSWNELPGGGGDWIAMPQRVGAKIAPLVGAQTHEVIACDSVSVNLAKLIGAALSLNPGRKVVLSEPGNFPTDLYMIQGQPQVEQRLAARDKIIEALDESVALLLLTHVHYKTGEMFDMERLTKAAHDVGAIVLWDLSHSGGAVPVDLNGANADLAVGCGYKYLNGGPGAPAYAYVAERHHGDFSQPLTGWFGHAQPFAFSDEYEPGEGVKRLLAGTPPVLAMAALESGVELIAEIGMEALVPKSRALSEFFRECVAGLDLDLVSPRDPAQRGSQLSFRHENAYALSQALIARGVIGDFRDPDILRLGFAPAYLRFEDIAEAARHLAQVLESGEWQRDEFATRAAVT
ncbi:MULTISPECIES: kynureninase [Citromicrobium]|uniref:kynureninase n=1 Tax=Citromicrobium TaxID=72173 RepID=UPI0001DD0C38|nr:MULTISPECIES: kynureninase [Citromicrobium]ALG59764.1 kynureninase [Citromicrobium sp. JL477]KPM17142.1 kynureninase [Citromicrobium sp. JL1351]KPM20079.1 kynureninase [Citromicrobium sp. JL31]KPM27261.1 kynureninase [Citromicrobium sp. JL2201]